VVADLNKDAKLDVATISVDGSLDVLLGNGNGTLKAPVSTPVASGGGAGLLVADVNNDGNADLVISIVRSGFGTMLGRGDGTFAAFTLAIGAGTEGGLAAADFNNDGKLDVAFSLYNPIVAVTFGNGDGTFQQFPPSYQTTANTYGLVLADLNRDGRRDIVTSGGGAVGVLLGNSDGTFPLDGMTFPLDSGVTVSSVAVGDLNGDGLVDVVAPDSGAITVNIFLGKGDGTLLAATQAGSGQSPTDVKITDMNLDGKPDIVVANDISGNPSFVTVLSGKGDGTFDPFRSFATGVSSHSVAVGDLNADGLPDLVVANRSQGGLSVLLNTSH